MRSLGKDFVKLAWGFLYLVQFVCLEFFFRGFMLNALRPALGANAVFVMCVPYTMIHFPKLWPEAAGAMAFGLFLGLLALRSRSIWGGVAVHAAPTWVSQHPRLGSVRAARHRPIEYGRTEQGS